jgi:hypothetical protein
MADKTPVRVVYSSGVATGLAEFQSTETVGYAFGGTGLSSLGSAGQVLKVNAAGTAMEFGAEGDISITNLVAPTNADLTLTTSGTGNIILDGITIRGTTLSAADSSKITVAEALDVTGALTASGLAYPTSDGSSGEFLKTNGSGTLSFASGGTTLSGTTNNTVTTVTGANAVQGEANLTFDGSTLAVTGAATISTTLAVTGATTLTGATTVNNSLTANSLTTNTISSNGSNADLSIQPSGTGDVLISALRVNGTTLDSSDSTKVTIAEAVDITGALVAATSINIASDGATVTGIKDEDGMDSDSATKLATQQSIKAYVDAKVTAEDLDVASDSGTAAVDLDSQSLTVTGGTGIGTTATGQAVTINIDATVTTLTGTQTLTNKTLTAPTITATSTTVGGKIKFLEGTDNGTNGVTLVGAASTADVDVILPAAADTLVGKATTDTFTNKTFDLGGTGNSLTGSLAEFNSALQSDSFVSLTGSETLTNKTLTSPVINGPTGDWIKIEGTNFSNSLLIGHATTGTLSTATHNTGVGIGALDALTSGDSNAVLGYGAGTAITSGTQNVAVGQGALPAVLTTNDNSALGYGALKNTTGAKNIGIGENAGRHLSSGSGNVTIGGGDLGTTGNTGSRQLKIAGYDGSTRTTWIDGTSAGAITFNEAYTFPTTDGSDGQALVTDGSGTLTFGTVGSASVSDDSLGIAISDKRITSTARTIDSFHSTFQDSALYYVVSNDHNEDCIHVQKVSVAHNNTTAYCSSAGAQSKASTTMPAFTCDLSNDMVRLKAATGSGVGGTLSFYKFGLGDNSSAATSGNVIVTINADVDSAEESLVSFAHGTYRGAKLFISVNNDAKTEVGNIEALVVHDGTTAYISIFGEINSGNNSLLTLTAAIDGSNVVVSAAGGEANLRVTVHAIMLKDTMVSDDGTYSNTEAIAPVTISSTATEVDTLVEASNNGAVYYLVSKNASEGHYAVNEVFMAMASGEITVASGPFVSTKGTNQLAFTSDYKDDVENTGQLLCSSTSGGSTIVSAYRINCLAK